MRVEVAVTNKEWSLTANVERQGCQEIGKRMKPTPVIPIFFWGGTIRVLLSEKNQYRRESCEAKVRNVA